MSDAFNAWVHEHLRLFGLPVWASLLLASGLLAAVSIVLTAWALLYVPADYFVGPSAPDWTRDRHPVFRWGWRVVRNLLGAALVVVGILLSFPGVPGQGLLTILLGLMLVEFPGKRRLEQRLVARPAVFRSINRIRARFGRAPLKVEKNG